MYEAFFLVQVDLPNFDGQCCPLPRLPPSVFYFRPEPRSNLSLVPGLSLFPLRLSRACCFFFDADWGWSFAECDLDFGVGYALVLKLDFPTLVCLFFYKGIYVRCACAMLCLMGVCFLTLHDLAQLLLGIFRIRLYLLLFCFGLS